MKSSDGPAPSKVSPCLLVDSIENELGFLKAVFQVTVFEGQKPEGTIWQVEAKLGDTVLKIGRAHAGGAPTCSVLYVWTSDLDGTFARAIQEGATLISEPTEQPWGGREAGFRDPQGQIWWIGNSVKRPSNRQVEEALRQQRKHRL